MSFTVKPIFIVSKLTLEKIYPPLVSYIPFTIFCSAKPAIKCEPTNPCKNGGTCQPESEDGKFCHCPNYFVGNQCEINAGWWLTIFTPEECGGFDAALYFLLCLN